MTVLLTTLAEITLTMSAVIALLLALGPLLSKRYPASWRYWAWLFVAVRLLIPFNLTLPAAPIQIEAPADRVVYTYRPPAQLPAVTSPPGSAPAATAPVTQAPVPNLPAAAEAKDLTSAQILPYLWLVGAAGLALWYLLGWLRFTHYVRRWAAPVQNAEVMAVLNALSEELSVRPPRLLVCPGVAGPMMAGVFHPAILLPGGTLGGGELWFVLRHELMHYKRRDILYKVLLLLAKLVHWFNPLVWVMVRAAEGDMERACDDAVVRGLPEEARSKYTEAILAALPRKSKEVLP